MIIHEGSVKIETLSTFIKGPGKISPGFYNKTMEVSRDMTVALLQTVEPGIALDSMAGTGIRGLRIAKETKWRVVLNDRDETNFAIQRKNAERNSVNVEMTREDYFCSVSSRKWDYVDLDPYGTPSGMVEAATMNLKNNGILGVTMTDTANLEGNSISKGVRIYGAKSIQGQFAREVATRIFLKFVLERGAALGRAGTPLISLRDGHYIRTFVKFKKGNKVADHSLESIRKVKVGEKMLGPMYCGKLYDEETLVKLAGFNFSARAERLFLNFRNEDLMFLFYTNDYLGKEIRKAKIIEAIKRRGYEAGQTNFNEKGIKSNIGHREYQKVLGTI